MVRKFFLFPAGLFIIAFIGAVCALSVLFYEYWIYKDKIPDEFSTRVSTRISSGFSSKIRRKELEIEADFPDRSIY
jgi:hypothetical protein